MADVNAIKGSIAYWNVNIPIQEWTDECPEYLRDVDHWDRTQLWVRDVDYELMSWEEVKKIVNHNRLELFKRIPSDLRRYRKYIAEVKRKYGSVMNMILKERVKWVDLTPLGGAFEYPEDVRILWNDWPYGVDKKIVHLVCWTKFGFEEDVETGDLTPKARKLIDDFVTFTFRHHEDPQRILWFKNWAALKSVHAIEHFHVMLYNPDSQFIRNVTNGDVPLSQRLKKP